MVNVLKPSRFFRLLPTLAAAFLAVSAVAQTSSPFMRLQKPSATKEVLQTKARLYTPANGNGPAVWLVGVAHVGQAKYYKDIEKLLGEQTTVLYEGVTRKGVDPTAKPETPGQKTIYQSLSDTLGLQFQLLSIDYKKPSFRNSDLSWEEMSELESKGGATAKGGMNLSTIGNMLNPESQQGKMLVAFLDSIKSDPSSIEAMRLVMIETLADPASIDRGLSPSLGDLIIKKRNEKVLEDLKTEIAKQPAQKSIAIFYGAAHMADMEKRLMTDFGYKAGQERWFSAMEGDTSKVTGNGDMILKMMRAQMESQKKKPAGGGGGGGR